MDTFSFLNMIVPRNGVKFVVEWLNRPNHPRGGVMIHHPSADHDAMVDLIAACAGRGNNTYYAMATYKEVEYKTTTAKNGREFTYVAGRKQSNVKAVKCLWVDFDVGKASKSISYETREDALASLKHYITETKMPVPLLVSSGNGFHAYWVFEEELDAEDWLEIAALQRAAMQSCGIKFDASRDVDSASILRPLGTPNFNAPGNRPVSLVKTKTAHAPQPAFVYKAILQRFAKERSLPVTKPKPVSNLAPEEREYPPSSLEIVATHCAQLRDFRDGVHQSQGTWYACLGVAKFCTNGEALAHEWSAHDPRYDAGETTMKLEQWAFRPTTCEKFRSECAERCAGCAHKVTSPILLGRAEETIPPAKFVEDPAPSANDPEDVDVTVSEEVKEKIKSIADLDVPPGWPEKFSVRNDMIYHSVKNEEGVIEHHPVAFPPYYVEYSTSDPEDGTEVLHIAMKTKRDGIRRFDMPRKMLADAKRQTKPFLMSYGITVLNEAAAMNHILQYANNIASIQSQIRTYDQFGWKDNHEAFLMGDQLVTERGQRTVRLSDKYLANKELHKMLDVKGNSEEAAEMIDFLYNRPGFEPFQYVFCTVFGALIADMIDDERWRGIPMALTSDNTGLGKTTVCQIALNMVSNSNLTVMSDITPKATLNRASNMNNVPVLFDEVTTKMAKPEDLMDFAYAMSNGRGRIRLRNDGTENAAPPGWVMMSLLTGNRNLMFSLGGNQLNPEAAQMRILEISLDMYYGAGESLAMRYGKDVGKALDYSTKLVNEFSCTMFMPYIRTAMKHRWKIKDAIRAEFVRLMDEFGDNSTKERFYAYHIACSIVGGKLAQKLGFLKFDILHTRKWIIEHVKKLRSQLIEDRMSPEEQFSMLLTDHHGTILVTHAFETLDARSGKVELIPVVTPKGFVAGRLVLGTKDEPPRLFMSVRAISEWCRKLGFNWNQMRKSMTDAGIMCADRPESRVYLSRGVPTVPAGRTRTIEFNVKYAQGYIDAIHGTPASEIADGALKKASVAR